MIKLNLIIIKYRLNAEISAFSSGDLNKYEFLTRKYLNLAFSTGLNKTDQGYQKEGVIKLLKDIRDGLAGRIDIPAGLIISPPEPPKSPESPK